METRYPIGIKFCRKSCANLDDDRLSSLGWRWVKFYPSIDFVDPKVWCMEDKELAFFATVVMNI